MPEDAALLSALRGLPVRLALLTDAHGAILLRVGEASDDALLDVQRMGATFAQTAEQAGKAGLGKNLHTTAFYGARATGRCARTPTLPAEKRRDASARNLASAKALMPAASRTLSRRQVGGRARLGHPVRPHAPRRE